VRRRMLEAGMQFRRVNGHLHLKTLRTALERHRQPPAQSHRHRRPGLRQSRHVIL
jgi:hypothetical protein